MKLNVDLASTREAQREAAEHINSQITAVRQAAQAAWDLRKSVTGCCLACSLALLSA